MKEKHDLETEALLSVLSDSQRTTTILQEENLQLRDHIRHRFASGVLPPRVRPVGPFARSPHDRPALLPSPLAAPRRPTIPRSLSHAHTNGRSVSAVDQSPLSSRTASPSHGDLPAVAALRPRRQRASTSSSVFPNLPQNMSLLMYKATMHDRPGLSSSPPPPSSLTRGMPQHSSLFSVDRNSGGGGRGHAAHNYTHPHPHAYARHTSSLSSETANISPTIAGFSMTEIPGSPSSLQRQPEHELHLGDMPSLSIYAMSDLCCPFFSVFHYLLVPDSVLYIFFGVLPLCAFAVYLPLGVTSYARIVVVSLEKIALASRTQLFHFRP